MSSRTDPTCQSPDPYDGPETLAWALGYEHMSASERCTSTCVGGTDEGWRGAQRQGYSGTLRHENIRGFSDSTMIGQDSRNKRLLCLIPKTASHVVRARKSRMDISSRPVVVITSRGRMDHQLTCSKTSVSGGGMEGLPWYRFTRHCTPTRSCRCIVVVVALLPLAWEAPSLRPVVSSNTAPSKHIHSLDPRILTGYQPRKRRRLWHHGGRSRLTGNP